MCGDDVRPANHRQEAASLYWRGICMTHLTPSKIIDFQIDTVILILQQKRLTIFFRLLPPIPFTSSIHIIFLCTTEPISLPLFVSLPPPPFYSSCRLTPSPSYSIKSNHHHHRRKTKSMRLILWNSWTSKPIRTA